jgi:hypothetical protein
LELLSLEETMEDLSPEEVQKREIEFLKERKLQEKKTKKLVRERAGIN